MQKLGQRNLILVGFMGTGKSTIGRQIADRLGRKILDVDDQIETWADKTIPEIFSEDGELAFRAWELKAAEYISLSRRLVVATGGGFITNPRCIDFVRPHGVIITLTAPPELILERIMETDRPLINVDDQMQRITTLLAERQHIYDRFPQFSTANKTPFQIADEIISYVN